MYEQQKKSLIRNPALLIVAIMSTKPFYHFPDEAFLKIDYFCRFGRRLNLKNPRRFNDKMQWLKLNDRKPEYSTYVDKYEVRQFIANTIGEQYLIPAVGIWDNVDDIDFDSLPDQYVLKCTHDSGSVVLCADKAKFDVEAAKHKLKVSLSHSFYARGREWPYKNVKPRIVGEKFMSDYEKISLSDYKIHCFNGKPKVILVCRDRFEDSGLTEDFFTENWEHLNVARPYHPNASNEVEKPAELDEMLRLAEKLAKGIPFVRIDFYTINHQVYFGEMTMYPASGFEAFVPDEWDFKFGDMLKLPEVRK